MKLIKVGKKTLRYALVGLSAASIHGCVLVELSRFYQFWISNVFAFLTASIFSYLGHALFTFRDETTGHRFAKRWLVVQFTVNICVSALLPIILSPLPSLIIKTGVLIFTPTLINALIWSKAARYSSNRKSKKKNSPYIHADDFGLTEATNKAILSLIESNKLNSASLMVNGNATRSAIEGWKNNSKFPLFLHLCLSEGPSTSPQNDLTNLTTAKGCLNMTFIRLLLISLLPKNNRVKKMVKNEVRKEIHSQISLFKELTGLNSIQLDGHQHIHLIPVVLEILLEMAPYENIKWLRTTYEPIPPGIGIRNWFIVFLKGGFVKWIILQILSYFGKRLIYKASIFTNSGFSGVIFTGHMSREVVNNAWQELEIIEVGKLQTPPMILLHPGAILSQEEKKMTLSKFPLSKIFFESPWRQKEWNTIRDFKPN